MRKLLMITLCLLLVVSLAIPALAAGTVTLAANYSYVYRNGEFTVTVSASGIDSCKYGGIDVSFGSSFELVSGKWLLDADMEDFDVTNKDGVFMVTNPIKLSGKVFQFTLKVKSGAAFAKDKVTVKLTVNGEEMSKSMDIHVICNHKYSNWADAGNSKHSHKCSICGNTESNYHYYDNDCDTSCNACGATRTITHQYSEEWTGDETGHWHACAVCGAKDTVVEHTPGEEAGEYTDQVCTVCNFVLTPALGHQHRYETTYESDETGHWKTCTGCGEKAGFAEHDFDGSCDETCDRCGYQRQVTHNEGAWKHSDTEHWQTCGSCKTELNKSEHSWDAGVMEVAPTTTKTGVRVHKCSVCDAVKRETIPVASIIDPIGGWPWWTWLLVGIGSGAVITVGVGLLMIVLGVKKKSKGRFSGN